MADIVRVLGQTYREDGIALWLAAQHHAGPLAGDAPIYLCTTQTGRDWVYAVAEGLTGQVAT